MLTAEKALVNPAVLILFQKLLFCYLLPRHPLPEIEVNGVVKNAAKNKVVVGKDRDVLTLPPTKLIQNIDKGVNRTARLDHRPAVLHSFKKASNSERLLITMPDRRTFRFSSISVM